MSGAKNDCCVVISEKTQFYYAFCECGYALVSICLASKERVLLLVRTFFFEASFFQFIPRFFLRWEGSQVIFCLWFCVYGHQRMMSFLPVVSVYFLYVSLCSFVCDE